MRLWLHTARGTQAHGLGGSPGGAEKKERQGNHTAAKNKCVLEQAALAKASRDVVDYVGNMEMPKWSDDNKE
jgi:hypothetical protein